MVWQIVSGIIISFGGSGLIILGLSTWLGKIWANRIMQEDRSKHDKVLEELRSQLTAENNHSLEQLKADLDIFKDQNIKGLHEKLGIYRSVVDIISETLGNFDQALLNDNSITSDKVDVFNRKRIQAYGYLAMMAPQALMDANNELFDHLIKISNGQIIYEWDEVREFSNNLLNEMRKDLKFNTDGITYNGEL